MSRIAGRLLPALSLLLFACTAGAQVRAGIISQPVRPIGNPAPQKVQPYTAEFKITDVRTLANGTTIARESTEIVARDSMGRNVTSTTRQIPQLGMEPGTFVRVYDPDGSNGNWDSRSKTARLVKFPPRDQQHGCWASDFGYSVSWGEPSSVRKPRPNRMTLPPLVSEKPQVEDLGTTSIQGVPAEGRRVTRTIPAGQIGNDQTIISVSETWLASALGIPLREIDDDPQTGKRTRELVSLTLDEPDPALFQPPTDYEVRTDELHQVTCPKQ